MNDDDEDRAAILRRRRQLIALALSGLTSAAGCDEPAPPEPAAVETVAEQEEPAAVELEEAPEPAPVEEEPPAPYEPDPAEVQHAEDAKRRWRERQAPPRVCLSVRPQVCLTRIPSRHVRPQVCLSEAPVVCLSFRPTDDPDDDA